MCERARDVRKKTEDGKKDKACKKKKRQKAHLGVIGELRALVPDAEEDGAVHHALPHTRLHTHHNVKRDDNDEQRC